VVADDCAVALGSESAGGADRGDLLAQEMIDAIAILKASIKESPIEPGLLETKPRSGERFGNRNRRREQFEVPKPLAETRESRQAVDQLLQA